MDSAEAEHENRAHSGSRLSPTIISSLAALFLNDEVGAGEIADMRENVFFSSASPAMFSATPPASLL